MRQAKAGDLHLDGALVRRLRQERGYSVARFAAEFGFSRSTVTRLEYGSGAYVWPATLTKLAAALGVEPAALIAKEPRHDADAGSPDR